MEGPGDQPGPFFSGPTAGRAVVARRAGAAAARGVGAPLPPPASLQPANAPGRLVAGGAPALGCEPLLLPSQHPHQGCADSRQLPRARSAPAVATADRRSRRAAGRGGRDRGMAAPRGGDGGVARGSADATPAAAGRTLRGGRLRLVLSDRKSTRLNSSHLVISYAVFCLKKKK